MKLPIPLLCQGNWQTMCPVPFLLQLFSLLRLSTVSYFWLRAARRGDKALDVENVQSLLHNYINLFCAISVIVPDIQTLCLHFSIGSTPKQLHRCLCLNCMLFHITILRLRSLSHLIIRLNPCSETVFPHKFIVKLRDKDAKFSHIIKNLCLHIHLLLPLLSTLLDFNHRYSGNSANECRSFRVHPKVTHLKPSSTRGKHYPLMHCILTPMPRIKCSPS